MSTGVNYSPWWRLLGNLSYLSLHATPRKVTRVSILGQFVQIRADLGNLPKSVLFRLSSCDKLWQTLDWHINEATNKYQVTNLMNADILMRYAMCNEFDKNAQYIQHKLIWSPT